MEKVKGAARRGVLALFIVVVGGLGAGGAAQAAPPPDPFFNGFEVDTAGWFPLGDSSVTREPSGFSTGAGGYASGVASATGDFHARLGLGDVSSCASGGGPQPVTTGPFTRWDGYTSTFPTGGYRTDVAIYFDVAYAQAHLDTRFDFSSAVNNSAGFHLRDFVFNVGTDTSGFVVSASTHSTRCGVNPYDPGHDPAPITQSGWYMLRHWFRNVGGVLSVQLDLVQCTTSCPRAV